jgi:hypothetical protein
MKNAEVTDLRHTIRASKGVPGYVDVLEGSKPILSFWTWDCQVLVADGDNATKVVFKGPWHERIRVPLIEVRAAMDAASALRRAEKLKDGE